MIGYALPAVCKRHYHNLLSYKTKQIIGCYFRIISLYLSVKNQLDHYLKQALNRHSCTRIPKFSFHHRKAATMSLALFCMLFGILVCFPETGEI